MIATFQGGSLGGARAFVDLDVFDPKQDSVVGVINVGWITKNGLPKTDLAATILQMRYRVIDHNKDNITLQAISGIS